MEGDVCGDERATVGWVRGYHVAADPGELLDRLAAFEPPTVRRWLELDRT